MSIFLKNFMTWTDTNTRRSGYLQPELSLWKDYLKNFFDVHDIYIAENLISSEFLISNTDNFNFPHSRFFRWIKEKLSVLYYWGNRYKGASCRKTNTCHIFILVSSDVDRAQTFFMLQTTSKTGHKTQWLFDREGIYRSCLNKNHSLS